MLRIATEKNLPVIVYDSHSDRAGVLMNLDYFESHFDQELSFDEGYLEDDEEPEEDIFEESPAFVPEYVEEDDMADLEQKNKDLALWRAKREDKEREEIERILEEELAENPLTDPFEEDYLHTPEWHKIGDNLDTAPAPQTEKPLEAPAKEPSYHPVLNNGETLSWTDWTFAPGSSFDNAPETIILQEKNDENLAEEGEEDPVFLEEPV